MGLTPQPAAEDSSVWNIQNEVFRTKSSRLQLKLPELHGIFAVLPNLVLFAGAVDGAGAKLLLERVAV